MESQEECFVIDDLNRAGDAVSGLYGETCDSFDSELHLVSVDNMLSLDALLADLQNTISPTNGLTSPGSGSGSGYGSLNGTRGRDPVGYGGDYGTTRSVTSERYETRHSQGPVSVSSPIHQLILTDGVVTQLWCFSKRRG
ncbi:hypothetical protein L798_10322 [Zootermopsis nevadensis]|uniref:Uncharacterized protein n=1 Tax=Zootermopsis nevadensis TaxID=136037 RepID=A0A067R1E2_ZOONE|nr:hypothetical protein L798_10322 [Zootermopsis nevadensis]